jgi:hypothetical protein
MKIEYKINNTKTMTREEAMNTDPKLLTNKSPIVTVSHDDEVILRTSKLEEVQQIFQTCLKDLKRIAD